jgi:hypothetical protein
MAKRHITNGLLMQATNNIIVLNDILQHIKCCNPNSSVFATYLPTHCLHHCDKIYTFIPILLHYFSGTFQRLNNVFLSQQISISQISAKHYCELNFVVFFRLNAASPYI